MSVWDEHPELIDRAIKFWREGYSAAQAARMLGYGITRSAVLGKLHRSGLAELKRYTHPPRSRSALGEKRILSLPEIPLAAIPVPVTAPEPRTRDGQPVTLGNALTQECRFPLWSDTEHELFQVCGNSCPEFMPYCDYHAKICYRAAPPKKNFREAA